jgi:hypothetical protein
MCISIHLRKAFGKKTGEPYSLILHRRLSRYPQIKTDTSMIRSDIMSPENSDRSEILRDATPDGSRVGTSGSIRITACLCPILSSAAGGKKNGIMGLKELKIQD